VGHSGVGKSSLVNALAPELDLETGEVKRGDGTGRHTTTRSSLFDLGDGIRVIDTPGVREFGLWDLEAADVRASFEDFQPYATGCRFSDCTHIHEPSCGVLEAVERGDVAQARYDAYRRIVESVDD
ncbi:MAG: ribosome small subunit-dependent GTPase A, partial [Acidobacteria bacterium]|nr:ribosome small subunit-dependent GTPase A [Acidobacteriota bacterium]